jgi:hypothetical protein
MLQGKGFFLIYKLYECFFMPRTFHGNRWNWHLNHLNVRLMNGGMNTSIGTESNNASKNWKQLFQA